MGQFWGTHQGRLDAKNRVSIPASYRAQLKAEAAQGPLSATANTPLVLRPSHADPCIEVWSETDFAALASQLSKYEEFTEEYDDLSITLFADATPAEADKEGRVVLPASLLARYGLTDQSNIVFMGRGKIFQIWDAAQAEQRKQTARQRTLDLRQSRQGHTS